MTGERADDDPGRGPVEASRPSLPIGTVAIAAGAVQAFAAGTVADHRAAVTLFAALGAVQILWGIGAERNGGRSFHAAGVVVHLGALVVWLGATISGLSFVDGLEATRPFDATAAVALLLCGGVGFASLARLADSRPREAIPSPSARSRWTVSALAATAVVVAAVATNGPPRSGAGADPVAPPVTVTTLPGPIGLPTGPGGNIDQQLGALIEATDPSTTAP